MTGGYIFWVILGRATCWLGGTMRCLASYLVVGVLGLAGVAAIAQAPVSGGAQQQLLLRVCRPTCRERCRGVLLADVCRTSRPTILGRSLRFQVLRYWGPLLRAPKPRPARTCTGTVFGLGDCHPMARWFRSWLSGSRT